MKAAEGDHAPFGLQLGLVDVEIHAVDAFHFQSHMLTDDFRNSARYTHGWLRSSSIPRDQLPLRAFTIGGASAYPAISSTGAFLTCMGHVSSV